MNGHTELSAVLVADEALRQDAEQAVLLLGGRVQTRIGWDQVASELGRQAGRPVLVVETEGVAPAMLADVLPRIDAVAAALDLPVVASVEEAAIDPVAASLFGPRIQLLCNPTVADRVAAIALAARIGSGAVLHEVRESDADRLRELNAEVARIAEVLARLTGQSPLADRPSADVADRRLPFDAGPGEEPVPVDAQVIRNMIRARRLRDGFFGSELFEDPAWDMLLDLFAAELEGIQVSVSSLCIAAAVPPTTALRWIGKMTEAGLFRRQPDPFDRRRAFMTLSEQALTAMHNYVQAVRRAGLATA